MTPPSPAIVPGFLLPPLITHRSKNHHNPRFSYRYAMQVTKLIPFAIKQLISKYINQ